MAIDMVYILILLLVTISVMYVILAIPSYTTSTGAAKRLRSRMNDLLFDLDQEQQSIFKERVKTKYTGFENVIISLPGGLILKDWIEQSGSKTTINKVMFMGFMAGAVSALLTYLFTSNILFTFIAFLFPFPLPILQVYLKRAKRLSSFEEQLPEALDIMTRALRAGHAFNEALGMVGDEMVGPVAEEFSRAYSDINYGLSLEAVFIALLQRVPSVSLQALTTAVLIQRQVGGNTAEILLKIAEVVRARFRFRRKVKTLTAEGRLSGWILALVPFALVVILFLASPDYLNELATEQGKQLITKGLFLEIIGVLWIRQLLRIDV